MKAWIVLSLVVGLVVGGYLSFLPAPSEAPSQRDAGPARPPEERASHPPSARSMRDAAVNPDAPTPPRPTQNEPASQRYWEIRQLVDQGKFAAAREEALRMKRDHPDSPLTLEVEQHLLVHPLGLPSREQQMARPSGE